MRDATWIVAAMLVLCGGKGQADESPAARNALQSLTPEEAKQLVAKSAGQTLHLNGLTTLDAATAKALVAFKGERLAIDTVLLNLGGAIPPTPDHARLAAADDRMLELPNITALDSADAVEIARSLAARKGPLKLPNLEKISPQTLTALIQKEDVEIPPIETLKLIPEPDGSVTEDFIIPRWLEQRQKRRP